MTQPTEAEVEAVARAMADAGVEEPSPTIWDPPWFWWRLEARAGIAALDAIRTGAPK